MGDLRALPKERGSLLLNGWTSVRRSGRSLSLSATRGRLQREAEEIGSVEGGVILKRASHWVKVRHPSTGCPAHKTYESANQQVDRLNAPNLTIKP